MAGENYSEKVSVNINSSTLSGIDLLVDNGYYSNRSDFINQAVRTALQQHQSTIDRIVDRNTAVSGDHWFIGVYGLTAKDIVQYHAAGKTCDVRGYGILHIGEDCDPELFFAVVQHIQVKGKVFGPAAIKAYYGIR